MENKIWLASTDEECWSGSEEYSSQGEAIRAGREDLCIEEDEGFFVGTKEEFVLLPMDSGTFLEHILNAYDHYDFTESWDDAVHKNKEIDNFVKLKMEEISDFIMKNQKPCFFLVENVKLIPCLK